MCIYIYVYIYIQICLLPCALKGCAFSAFTVLHLHRETNRTCAYIILYIYI